MYKNALQSCILCKADFIYGLVNLFIMSVMLNLICNS